MATTFKIKRAAAGGTSTPTGLANAELAFSGQSNSLFIGDPSDTSTPHAALRIGGGKYTYLHAVATPGVAVATGAHVVDANLHIDAVYATSFAVGESVSGGPVPKISTINTVANSTVLGAASNAELTSTWAIKNYVDTRVSESSPAGADTEIQFNDAGTINAVANLTYNKTTNMLLVGNSTINVAINSSSISVIDAGATATINSTNFSQTANNATNFAGGARALFAELASSQTFAGNNTLAGTNTVISSNIYSSGTSLTHGLAAGSGAFVRVGNSTINVVINATNFTGTANNALYLGGTLATGYALLAAGALQTFTSNITFAGTDSIFQSNVAVGNSTVAATLFVGNGTVNTSITGPETTLPATGVLTVGNSTVNVSTNATVLFLGNSTVSATINSTVFSQTANNATNFDGGARALFAELASSQTFAGNNTIAGTNTVISSNIYSSGTSLTHGLLAGSGAFVRVGNSTVNVVINSTAFTGSASSLGGVAASGYALLAAGALQTFTANTTLGGANTTITSNVTISSANLDMTSGFIRARDMTLSGNLTVSGQLTTIDATNITVTDSLISLAKDNSADILDIGTYGLYVATGNRYTGLFRDASDGIYKLFANSTVEPTTSVDTGATGYVAATLQSYLNSGGTGFAGFVANSTVVNITATGSMSVALVANTLSLTTALPAASGGTGQESYTTGDVLYASGASAVSKLGIGSDGHVLQVASGIPAWGVLDGGSF